jgi:integrase
LDRLYLGLVGDVGLAPATVRQVHAIVRRAFRQAVLWGWIASNPAANATPPRVAINQLSAPTVEQVITLLQRAKLDNPEFGRFLHVAASTGARRGEVCALRWNNLDENLKTLTIEHSIIDLPGGIAEKDTKNHISRRLALDPGTLDALQQQRAHAKKMAAASGIVLPVSAYVFSSEPDGRIPWVPGSVTMRFHNLRDSLNQNSLTNPETAFTLYLLLNGGNLGVHFRLWKSAAPPLPNWHPAASASCKRITWTNPTG